MKPRIPAVLMSVCIAAAVTIGARAEDAHEAEDHHFHKHHVGVFFGGTHDYNSEDAVTVGLDYEYRLTKLLGAMAFIDYAGGNIESSVVGAGLFFHPGGDVRLLTAVGDEVHNGHSEFVARLGALYDFHIENWTLSPTLMVDILESGHLNVIYGIGLGRGF